MLSSSLGLQPRPKIISLDCKMNQSYSIKSKIYKEKVIFKNKNISSHYKNIQKYYKPLNMRKGNRKTRNMLMNLSSYMNLWKIKGWPVLLTRYRGFDGIFFYGTFTFEHENYYQKYWVVISILHLQTNECQEMDSKLVFFCKFNGTVFESYRI